MSHSPHPVLLTTGALAMFGAGYFFASSVAVATRPAATRPLTREDLPAVFVDWSEREASLQRFDYLPVDDQITAHQALAATYRARSLPTDQDVFTVLATLADDNELVARWGAACAGDILASAPATLTAQQREELLTALSLAADSPSPRVSAAARRALSDALLD